MTKHFVYGNHNRMTQARNGSTVVMNYVYNGKGEQVRKYLNTTNTYSLYDEAGRWVGDYGNTAAPTQQVIWMGDIPVGVFVGSGASQKLHYIEADALGTPRAVVDPTRGTNGTAVWNWVLEGEAFGATAPNQDPDGDATNFVFNMRFPGQRFDSASGLTYNYFRDYEPGTGRYSQSDPIGLDGGISTYAYANSDPLANIDPDGLQFFPYSRNLNTRPAHRIPDQVALEANVVWGVATVGATVGTAGPIVISGTVYGAPVAASAAWNMTANVCKSPQARETALNVCVLIGVCVLERGPSRWVEHVKTAREISDTSRRGGLRRTINVTPKPK
jgi:RHS repeat-associated protein